MLSTVGVAAKLFTRCVDVKITKLVFGSMHALRRGKIIEDCICGQKLLIYLCVLIIVVSIYTSVSFPVTKDVTQHAEPPTYSHCFSARRRGLQSRGELQYTRTAVRRLACYCWRRYSTYKPRLVILVLLPNLYYRIICPGGGGVAGNHSTCTVM